MVTPMGAKLQPEVWWNASESMEACGAAHEKRLPNFSEQIRPL